ncbi:hypothetical protein [Candidatus Poriferisodalis sp.]
MRRMVSSRYQEAFDDLEHGAKQSGVNPNVHLDPGRRARIAEGSAD